MQDALHGNVLLCTPLALIPGAFCVDSQVASCHDHMQQEKKQQHKADPTCYTLACCWTPLVLQCPFLLQVVRQLDIQLQARLVSFCGFSLTGRS